MAGQSVFAGMGAAALLSCEASTALSFKKRDCEPSRNRLCCNCPEAGRHAFGKVAKFC